MYRKQEAVPARFTLRGTGRHTQLVIHRRTKHSLHICKTKYQNCFYITAQELIMQAAGSTMDAKDSLDHTPANCICYSFHDRHYYITPLWHPSLLAGTFSTNTLHSIQHSYSPRESRHPPRQYIWALTCKYVARGCVVLLRPEGCSRGRLTRGVWETLVGSLARYCYFHIYSSLRLNSFF